MGLAEDLVDAALQVLRPSRQWHHRASFADYKTPRAAGSSSVGSTAAPTPTGAYNSPSCGASTPYAVHYRPQFLPRHSTTFAPHDEHGDPVPEGPAVNGGIKDQLEPPEPPAPKEEGCCGGRCCGGRGKGEGGPPGEPEQGKPEEPKEGK